MEKSIINFESLEVYIKEIESLMAKSSLNQVEQDLVLRQTHQRLQKKIEEQKVKDQLNNIPMMGFAKKFMKDRGEDVPE